MEADSQVVEPASVLVGDVVQRDEDLLQRVLDDRGERAVPAELLAAEGEPPAQQPAGAAQRRVRGSARSSAAGPCSGPYAA